MTGCDVTSSGCTPDLPKLLKYTCRLTTNIRPVVPLKLKFEKEEDRENDELMTAVLKGRPLCALLFDDMTVPHSHTFHHDVLSHRHLCDRWPSIRPR